MHDLEVGFDFLLGIIPVWVRNLLGVLCQLAQAQSSLLIHNRRQTFQKSLFNILYFVCYVYTDFFEGLKCKMHTSRFTRCLQDEK